VLVFHEIKLLHRLFSADGVLAIISYKSGFNPPAATSGENAIKKITEDNK